MANLLKLYINTQADELVVSDNDASTFTLPTFYQGDVLPVLELLDQVEPDVVSVALDPEASGPDHYKVLQAVTEALRRYEQQSGRAQLTAIAQRTEPRRGFFRGFLFPAFFGARI